MNILSASDLRNKTVAELHDLLRESRRFAFEKRINLRAQQDMSSHIYQNLKTMIARILTILNEKK